MHSKFNFITVANAARPPYEFNVLPRRGKPLEGPGVFVPPKCEFSGGVDRQLFDEANGGQFVFSLAKTRVGNFRWSGSGSSRKQESDRSSRSHFVFPRWVVRSHVG